MTIALTRSRRPRISGPWWGVFIMLSAALASLTIAHSYRDQQRLSWKSAEQRYQHTQEAIITIYEHHPVMASPSTTESQDILATVRAAAEHSHIADTAIVAVTPRGRRNLANSTLAIDSTDVRLRGLSSQHITVFLTALAQRASSHRHENIRITHTGNQSDQYDLSITMVQIVDQAAVLATPEP